MAGRRFGDGSRGAVAVVSAGDVLTGEVQARVLGLVDVGCLVSLSRSRDGGAVAITVTADGEWEREWFRSAADAVIKLDEWAGLLEDTRAGSPATSDQRPRRGRTKPR